MRILQEIKDAIADDTDTGIVDKKMSKQFKEEDGSWGWKLEHLEPYKKINRNSLNHFAGEVVSLAAMVDREEGCPDKIHVTCGPVYHFFKQETLDAFLQRATNIIIAAEI